MTPTDTANASSAVADLKGKWAELTDVDRALAVHDLHESVRFRRLAKELGCSASLLRNLDKAAQAPQKDIDLARKGQISTRELALRSKAAEKLRATQAQEAHDQKRTKAAQQAAITICDWLDEHQFWPAHGENIVTEARRILAEAEYSGQLPEWPPPPPDMPVAEVISPMRPPASVNRDVGEVGWYADWLARWALKAFPDSAVRDKALNIALDSQIRGVPLPEKSSKK